MADTQIVSYVLLLILVAGSASILIREANGDPSNRGNFRDATRWAKSYTVVDSNIFSGQQTSDGGYIVAGVANIRGGPGQAWVMKLDTAGDIIWQNLYSSPSEPVGAVSSVAQTSDGGFIVAGNVYVIMGQFGIGDTEAWVFKLDGAGNMMWQKAFGGVFGHSFGFTVANSVQQTKDGGFIVAGGTADFGPGAGNVWVAKLDISGDVAWEETYGGNTGYLGAASASSIQQTSDRGYIVAGWTNQVPNNIASPLLLRLDVNGKIVWQKGYSSQNEFASAYSVKETSDKGFVVTGPSPLGHVWAFKTDSMGKIAWQNDFRFSWRDQGNSIDVTSDGGYVIGGSESFCSAAILVKLGRGGELVWSRSLGNHTGGSCIESVTPTQDGGFFAAGQVFLSQYGSGWVLKLDSNGLCCKQIALNINVTVTPTSASTVTSTLTSAQSTSVKTLTTATGNKTVAVVTIQCPVQRQNEDQDNQYDSDDHSSRDNNRQSESQGETTHHIRGSLRAS